jgi:di/tricarboxylate transporter
MTLQQALAFAIIAGAVAMFAWGRFRYDLVSLVALLIGVTVGLVKPKEAFTGFTSDVVVIIASALVVSAAIARSGVMEMVVRPFLPRLKSAATQAPVFAGVTALLSMPTKNVGALAILMPVALQVARKTETSPASLLMPMSFMSLLGGLVTLVGTSTNIIVSQVRQESLGKPFAMFDFAPVGLVLTGLGLVFVSFAWRVLPRDRKGRVDLGEAVAASAPYVTEMKAPKSLPEELRTVGDLKLEGDGVRLVGLMRDGERDRQIDRRRPPAPQTPLRPGDTLVLEGDQEALDRVSARTPLETARAHHEVGKEDPAEEMRSVEAVVQPTSRLVGRSAQRVRLQDEYGVNLLAVGRANARITERLRDVSLRAGDVLVLRAGEKSLPNAMKTLGVLPLAERDVRLGGSRRRFLPAVILALAMVLVGFKLAPVAIAFFGAAVLTVAVGGLSMREAYDSLEGQVLVLIGALTPLSEAVRHTGGADLIAHGLAGLMHGAPPLLTLGLLMITAMGCSPFLHNAPTVLVLAPIGVSLARQLHLNADPFLMAVATGAGCDFLTPVGHQCNTLVMGPGGYRFGDYWKLGLPLSVLVIVVGAPMIAWVWPLAQH